MHKIRKKSQASVKRITKTNPHDEKAEQTVCANPSDPASEQDCMLRVCPCPGAKKCPHRNDGHSCIYERALFAIDLDTPRGILEFLQRKAQFDWLSYVRLRRQEALGAPHKESATFGSNLLKTVELRTALAREFGLIAGGGKNSGDLPLENDSFKTFADWWKDEIES